MDKWIVTKLCRVNVDIEGITADKIGNVYFTAKDGILHLNTNDSDSEALFLHKTKSSSSFVGIVWDRRSNLFLCSLDNRIYQFDLISEQLIHVAGTREKGWKDGPAQKSKFIKPRGISIDINGNLYITDSHHVRKVLVKEQVVETVAGNSPNEFCVGTSDGDKTTAYFDTPRGICASEDGSIVYVCDYGNYSIRKIQDGIVSTIYGVGGYTRKSLPGDYRPESCVITDNGTLIVTDGRASPFQQTFFLQVDEVQLKLTEIKIPRARGQPLHLTRGGRGTIFFSTQNCIYKLEDPWNYEKFLWIGKLKENYSYCYLAQLPKDIIREIARHLRPIVEGCAVTCTRCADQCVEDAHRGELICSQCGYVQSDE